MRKIVEECTATMRSCPTDADLLTVARDIKGPDDFSDIPIPTPEQLAGAWKNFAHQFPHILENGKTWEQKCRELRSKVKAHMGQTAWMKATALEKMEVAEKLGYKRQWDIPSKHVYEDMGLACYVPRAPLPAKDLTILHK